MQEQAREDKAKEKDRRNAKQNASSSRRLASPKPEKTPTDVVLKAFERSLEEQIHNDKGYDQERRDIATVTSQKEKAQIL